MSLTEHTGEGSDALDSTIYNLKGDHLTQDSWTYPRNPTSDLHSLGLAGESCGTPPRVGSGGFGFLLWVSFLSCIAISKQKDVIAFVAKNWKIVLILMIPLFYQTVRTFLEEVQEAWGIKRSPKQPLTPEVGSLPKAPTSSVVTSPPEEE